jgi:hypothetical protein
MAGSEFTTNVKATSTELEAMICPFIEYSEVRLSLSLLPVSKFNADIR